MRLPDLFNAKATSGKSFGRLELAGWFLLLTYLVAGMIYSSVVAPVARFPDETDYLKLSYHLLHGPGYSMDGVHLTASRPPGYAFFLSALRALGGDFFSFRLTQFLLVGATILLLSRLCSEKKIVAGLLLATTLVFCYPVLFYTSATLYPQILAGFLFILALTFTLSNSRNPFLHLLAGLSYGALVLVVPTFLLTMLVVLACASFFKIIRWREGVLILITASLIVGTWTIRNAVVLHHFVPVATNSGLNFLAGNNENSVAYEGAAVDSMSPYYHAVAAQGLDEFQADQYYWHVASSQMEMHPWHALARYLARVLNFFNLMNAYAVQNKAEVSSGKQVVQAASYALLLALVGWRLSAIKPFPLIPREKLFLVVYVLSAFTSAIFLTRIRLRLPYDYLLIAIITLHLSRRLEIWMTSKSSSGSSLRAAEGK